MARVYGGSRILYFSPPQEWMSDIWIRKQRFGSAQCSIAEAASSRNISSNVICLHCLLSRFYHIRETKNKYRWEVIPGDKFLEVRVLARDVLHTVRARQPRLSACGLFDLRMSLVTGYLSLTTTYSIVLLQLTHLFIAEGYVHIHTAWRTARVGITTDDERGQGQKYATTCRAQIVEWSKKLTFSKANIQTLEAVCLVLEQWACGR
ncbi:hypothetical protein EVAR_57206_1 [Eumeta japonica]|uniref:Uncharacterized protein n=1 Tax=Eumeta variegata TaxID=151549 RepID=A0A4C1YHC0_EUMVA|nr:hypothetical protein EVAR_57206_1 [Eumeta japonica]